MLQYVDGSCSTLMVVAVLEMSCIMVHSFALCMLQYVEGSCSALKMSCSTLIEWFTRLHSTCCSTLILVAVLWFYGLLVRIPHCSNVSLGAL